MTRGELRNLVLSWLDDPDAGYFTVSQVNTWLNNAQLETQKQLIQAGQNWYMVCAETNTAQYVNCYALPSDFLKSHRLQVITGGSYPQEDLRTLVPITPMEMASNATLIGLPAAYFLKKNAIVFSPLPDRAYPIRMLYSYRVTPMTSDTEEPDVPEQYHEYLACLATKDGFLKDNRDPSQVEQKIAEYKALFKQDAQDRNEDIPRSVRVTQDWSSEYLY